MKRIVSISFALLVFMTTAICFAEIPKDEVALGGINLGATPEYVKSIYGEPTSYDRGYGDSIIYNYNGTFKVMFSGGKYMYWMETTANNGITTPSGIAVGMDASVLSQYGETYYDKIKDGIRQVAFWAKGRIVLEFKVKNNIIISIKASC